MKNMGEAFDNRTNEQAQDQISQHQEWEADVASRFYPKLIRSAPDGDRFLDDMTKEDLLPDYHWNFERKIYFEIKTTKFGLSEVAVERSRLHKCLSVNSLICFVQNYKGADEKKTILSAYEYFEMYLNFGSFQEQYRNLGYKPCYIVPQHLFSWTPLKGKPIVDIGG